MRAPGVLARRGVLVLASVPVAWLAAGLTDALWLLPAVPAVVWSVLQPTEWPRRRAAVRPVEPLEPPRTDWQTAERRYEALRAAEAPRWTDPDPAVLEFIAPVDTALERMRAARRQRWGAVPAEAREGFDRWARHARNSS